MAYGLSAAGALVFVTVFAAALALTARPGLFSGGALASQCRGAEAMAQRVAERATGAMAAFRPIEPVDLTALPYDGTGEGARTIADLQGRVTLFNLWATWCAPCRAEMPTLAGLHKRLGGDDFAVVATSIDSRDENRPEDFLEETDATALAYHREPNMVLFNSLKAAGLTQGMPTTLLLSEEGCAVGVLAGAAEWDSPEAVRLIESALAAS